MSIEFQVIDKVRRSVYPQFGGGVILADECKCQIVWKKHHPTELNFVVTRSVDCPIDEHRQEALNRLQSSEISTGDAQQCKTTG